MNVVRLLGPVPSNFSLGTAGAGLGTGLAAGFWVTNPKLGYLYEGFQTGDKEAVFFAVMTGEGKRWVYGQTARVSGRELKDVKKEDKEGCFEVNLYAQIL
tara:strand:- start:893 stop:1192 length:300 start_codon:yes stop_codon:yes gene_type:complete